MATWGASSMLWKWQTQSGPWTSKCRIRRRVSSQKHRYIWTSFMNVGKHIPIQVYECQGRVETILPAIWPDVWHFLRKRRARRLRELPGEIPLIGRGADEQVNLRGGFRDLD